MRAWDTNPDILVEDIPGTWQGYRLMHPREYTLVHVLWEIQRDASDAHTQRCAIIARKNKERLKAGCSRDELIPMPKFEPILRRHIRLPYSLSTWEDLIAQLEARWGQHIWHPDWYSEQN